MQAAKRRDRLSVRKTRSVVPEYRSRTASRFSAEIFGAGAIAVQEYGERRNENRKQNFNINEENTMLYRIFNLNLCIFLHIMSGADG